MAPHAAFFFCIHCDAFHSEFRYPIYQKWGGTVFAETAQVAEESSDLESNAWKYSIGGGLRYALNPSERFNIRLDLSYVDSRFRPCFKYPGSILTTILLYPNRKAALFTLPFRKNRLIENCYFLLNLTSPANAAKKRNPEKRLLGSDAAV